MQEYFKNRSQFPPEGLERYAGTYVAWSPDGTKIVATDEDPLKVVATVKAAGYDLAEVVISSVPSAEESGLIMNDNIATSSTFGRE
jgi:hypothetical protein